MTHANALPTRHIARAALAAAAMLLGCFAAAEAGSPEYEKIRIEAEEKLAAGRYAAAEKLYGEAEKLTLAEDDERWARFRLADARMRRLLSTGGTDEELAEAKIVLEDYTRDQGNLTGDRGRIGAEAHETLGDYFSSKPGLLSARIPYAAYYLAAQGWWNTRTGEEPEARKLALRRKMLRPAGVPIFGELHTHLSLAELEQLLADPRDKEEEAFLRLSVAVKISSWNNTENTPQERIAPEFEKAIAAGKGTRWHDDAVYNYAFWLSNKGPGELVGSTWIADLDNRKAGELFESIVGSLVPDGIGRCKSNDVALQLDLIRAPYLALASSDAYAPGAAALEVYLGWRNAAAVELGLYRLDLMRDVRLPGEMLNRPDWARSVSSEGLERVARWVVETGGPGDGMPHAKVLDLADRKLAPGAYLLEGVSGGASTRTAIMVTDVTGIATVIEGRAMVAVAGIVDGLPVSGATVRFWDGLKEQTATTDVTGSVVFDGIADTRGRGTFTAFISAGGRPATVNLSYFARKKRERALRVLVPRPFYRTGDTIEWTAIARGWDGANFVPVPQAQYGFEISNRDKIFARGPLSMDANGFAKGALDLPAELRMPEDFGNLYFRGKNLSDAVLTSLWDEDRTGPKSVGAHGMGRNCRVCHPPSHD